MDKIIVAALIVLMGIGASTPQATQPHETATIDTDRIYAVSTVVTAIDEDVVFTTFSGNDFAWSDIDDWEIGDIGALLMDNMGTANVEDDVILSATYCGYVS